MAEIKEIVNRREDLPIASEVRSSKLACKDWCTLCLERTDTAA